VKRSNLALFADYVHKCTEGNFFIHITYNPGRKSGDINIEEIFVAHPWVQCFDLKENEDRPISDVVKNIFFGFKNRKDFRDELGSVYGRGNTQDEAFNNLLEVIAGKTITITINGKVYDFDVPKDIAA